MKKFIIKPLVFDEKKELKEGEEILEGLSIVDGRLIEEKAQDEKPDLSYAELPHFHLDTDGENTKISLENRYGIPIIFDKEVSVFIAYHQEGKDEDSFVKKVRDLISSKPALNVLYFNYDEYGTFQLLNPVPSRGLHISSHEHLRTASINNLEHARDVLNLDNVQKVQNEFQESIDRVKSYSSDIAALKASTDDTLTILEAIWGKQ